MMHLLAQTEDPDVVSLSEAIDTSNLGLWDYLLAAAILVAAVLFGRVVRLVTKRVMSRTSADNFLGDLIGRILGYVVVAIGLVYALDSLGIAVTPVLGALGLVGFALAFALQDILENFVAGIILQLRRPFSAGDEIIAADHEGIVLEIDARTVTMRTPDGETVRLPSSEVIKNAIINHAEHGARRTTLEIGVAYGTDLDFATRVAAEAAANADGVMSDPAPQAFVHNFGSSSIDIALRFWHGPTIASQWAARDRVAQAVDAAFKTNQIEIPFPQRVFHMSRHEELDDH